MRTIRERSIGSFLEGPRRFLGAGSGRLRRLTSSQPPAFAGQALRTRRLDLAERPRELAIALEEARLHRARDENGDRPLGDAIRYIQSRLALMRYAEAQQRGLPMGTGAVEATCESLVSLRMKRAGSRWKPETGNEVPGYWVRTG